MHLSRLADKITVKDAAGFALFLLPGFISFLPLSPLFSGPVLQTDDYLQIMYLNRQEGRLDEDEEGMRGLQPIAAWKGNQMQSCRPPAAQNHDCNLFLHYGNLTGAKTPEEFKKAMFRVQASGWPDRFYLSPEERDIVGKIFQQSEKPAPSPGETSPGAASLEKNRKNNEDSSLLAWIREHSLPARPTADAGQTYASGKVSVALFGYENCEEANGLKSDVEKHAEADLFIVLLPGPSCLGSAGGGKSSENPYHTLNDPPSGFLSRTVFLYPASTNRFYRDTGGSYRCGSIREEACRLRLHFRGHNLIGVEGTFETFRDRERNHPIFPPALIQPVQKTGEAGSSPEKAPSPAGN